MNIEGISESFLALDSLLEESCGEITPQVEAAIDLLIEESPAALESAGFYVMALDRRIGVCKERRQALAAQIERTERIQDRVKTAMAEVLKRTGKQKFPEFTLSTTNRQSVAFTLADGVEAFELDSRFIRVREPELNLVELKAAHKAGNLPEQVQATTTESTSLMLRRVGAKPETTETAA